MIYRHWFNGRTHKALFYASMKWQEYLDLTRKVPNDIQMMIGSQWRCLRCRMIEAVLHFCQTRPDVTRFLRMTWFPDVTIIRHLVPEHEIKPRTLTILMFTDYGLPVSFYNDHYDLLPSQDYLFARKISPDATTLKDRPGKLYSAIGVTLGISNEGRTPPAQPWRHPDHAGKAHPPPPRFAADAV